MGFIHQAINDIFLATLVPECLIVLYLTGIIALGTLKVCLVFCLIVFVLLPLAFKYSVTLQRHVLFLTFINYPKDIQFAEPAKSGLYASRNFYVYHTDPATDHESDQVAQTPVKIGVWHILPDYIAKLSSHILNVSETDQEQLNEKPIPDRHASATNFDLKEFGRVDDTNRAQFFERTLQESSAEIVLYLHGNSNSRGAMHRVELYQKLRDLGYHVISLDYRGYGDSSSDAPTELGVVRDSIAVYNYIRSCTNNPVYLWGHSLGTGIATHMMSLLSKNNIPAPKVLVLESPFNNMNDEIHSHPLSRIFRNLPWFEYMVAQPLYSSHLRFESDQHISEFRQPVLIMHAEDDLVIPFDLGYKLYRSALDSRGKSWGPVEFHRFGAENHFGHKYICRSIELPHIVTSFLDTYGSKSY